MRNSSSPLLHSQIKHRRLLDSRVSLIFGGLHVTQVAVVRLSAPLSFAD